MNYSISKPSLFLSNFVKHYWTIENCIPTGNEHIQRIIPNGLQEIIFYFRNKPETIGAKHSISHNAIITGQLNDFYDLKITGNLSLFGIIFQPYGLSSFFDIPTNEFSNQNIPLKYILKDKVDELETKLFEAKTFNERIMIAEQFLSQRLKQTKTNFNLDRIKQSIDEINRNKGILNIQQLASNACFSRKQYERVFIEIIGTTPKQFLKTIRFQNAIFEKSKDKNLNLTTLTYQCGYYDQSHMTNDFQKLSGLTPKHFFNDCDPFSDYFM